MKKLLYLILVTIFIGCSEISPSSGKFVVRKMESYKANTYKYYLYSVKGHPNFYMISDSIYIVGDTLTLTSNKR